MLSLTWTLLPCSVSCGSFPFFLFSNLIATVFSIENPMPLVFVHCSRLLIAIWIILVEWVMVAAETKMVKSSTYRVQCTSDPSCYVISLMAIAKRVTLNTLPCGRSSSCTKYSEWEAPTLTQNSQNDRKPSAKAGRFPLRPISCMSFNISCLLQCRKPSLGQRKTAQAVWNILWEKRIC